jgi:organic radical activating enzyme
MVLVITGGEPSLQKNLAPFLERMNNIFQNTQIESNGILTLDLPKETTVVVSPKCVEKNGTAIKYLTPSQNMLEQAACLKFVMEATPGSPYSDIPDWAHEWALKTRKPVYISPMNIYNKEPQKAKDMRSKNITDLETRSTIEEVISFWEPGLLDMKANQENHEYVGRFCIQHGYIMNLQIHLFASLA